jgi:hypothetical protein
MGRQPGQRPYIIYSATCPSEHIAERDLNTKLRTGKYGNVYATENLELLWKNSKDRYVTGEPKFDPKNPDKEAKLHPEFGSKLYKGVDGVVRADGHFYESSSALINWDNVVNNSDCGILVGDAHTHPNEGARFILRNAQNPQGLGGSFNIDQASSFDKGHWSNGYSENHPKNYFDIIIQNGTYKFHNKDESFDVPRNFK